MKNDKRHYEYADIGWHLINDGWGQDVENINSHVKELNYEQMTFAVLAYICRVLKHIERKLDPIEYVCKDKQDKIEREITRKAIEAGHIILCKLSQLPQNKAIKKITKIIENIGSEKNRWIRDVVIDLSRLNLCRWNERTLRCLAGDKTISDILKTIKEHTKVSI